MFCYFHFIGGPIVDSEVIIQMTLKVKLKLTVEWAHNKSYNLSIGYFSPGSRLLFSEIGQEGEGVLQLFCHRPSVIQFTFEKF